MGARFHIGRLSADVVRLDEAIDRIDQLVASGKGGSVFTPNVDHVVNAERLAMMKPSAFLINTSRGPLVDERALAEALNAGRIAGAGLDVLAVEPPPADHPLYKAKNCQITPHIAWATRAARQRLLDTAVANVREFLAGKPQNVVNP